MTWYQVWSGIQLIYTGEDKDKAERWYQHIIDQKDNPSSMHYMSKASFYVNGRLDKSE